MKTVWGFDIGGTKCAIVAGDEAGNTLSRYEIATKDYPDWQGVLNALLAHAPAEKPIAVGVSCGGPLDSARGMILSPPNLPGWDEVPIVAWLEERVGVPAYLQNDANACALAEWKFGAGRGTKNMVFMTFGTGLGAGLILDGHLYAGTNDMAGEIGHVRSEADGPIGYGKAGSYEGFCSGGGIAQLAGGISAKEVAMAADKGDPAMLEVLHNSARHLGMCLSILIDILNPERIVIGSVYARTERHFKEEMWKVIRQEALGYAADVCEVVPAELGNSIGDIAAMTVAWNGLKEAK